MIKKLLGIAANKHLGEAVVCLDALAKRVTTFYDEVCEVVRSISSDINNQEARLRRLEASIYEKPNSFKRNLSMKHFSFRKKKQLRKNTNFSVMFDRTPTGRCFW